MKHYTHYKALLLFILTGLYNTPSTGREATGNLPAQSPLCFIENKGQITDQYGKTRKDIEFKLKANGLNIFIGDGAIHYQWYQSNNKEKRKNEKMGLPDDGKSPPGDISSYRMDVVLLGANKTAVPVENETNDYYENYYTEPIGLKGATAHSFKRITYKNVYPNIDWVLYISNGALKYDFLLHPGGDVKTIRLQYNGATGLELKNGALIAVTPMGSITEQAPYTYTAETHKEIKSNFILNNNILSYNIALPLGSAEGMEGRDGAAFIIDPVLDWATYYGGSSVDFIHGTGTDGVNPYIVGETHSSSNIATIGAYQTTFNTTPQQDAFIAKLSNAGAVLWATYYGGANIDLAYAIDGDLSGNVYIAGFTISTSNIATAGAHQSVNSGPFTSAGGDNFLAKFSNAGTLLWATYYGGSGHEPYADVVCDNTGNVFLCGNTGSTTGIATAGAHQSALAGGDDAYIAKFNSSGVRLWGTYYGGSDDERATTTDCDAAGNIIITGTTSSNNGIATTGAHLTTFNDGPGSPDYDAFIAKFSTTGSLQWGTYYGGYGLEWANDIACDTSNNIFIVGQTLSITGIATTGAHQVSIGGGGDGFLTKFNAAGVQQWGTYYGGADLDELCGVRVTANNYVYATGYTQSTSAIATPGAYHASLAASSASTQDAMLLEFTTLGTRKYATYYGGTSKEDCDRGITCTSNAVFFCGWTQSNNGIATTGAHQTSFAGLTDGYLVKFLQDTVAVIPQFYDTSLCAGDTIYLQHDVSYNYKFRPNNVFTAQLSNASGSFSTPVSIGSRAGDSSGTILCIIPAGTVTGGGYRIRITTTNPASVSADNDKNIGIGNLPPVTATSNSPLCDHSNFSMNVSSITTGAAYAWSGPFGYTAAGANASLTNTSFVNAGDYIVTAKLYGCVEKDTVTLVVNPLPVKPIAASNTPICSTDTLRLLSATLTTGVGYSWTGPNGFTSPAQNPSVNNPPVAAAGDYIVTATITATGCSAKDTETVTITQSPSVTATNNSPVCEGSTVSLSAAASPVTVVYSWSGPGSFSSPSQNPVISNAATTASGDYIVSATLNGCTGKDTTTVLVKPDPIIPVTNSNTPVCIGGTLNLTAASNAGSTYSWTGPNSFSSILQNPSKAGITAADAGIYSVIATLNGCTSAAGTTTVVVNPQPFVTIYATPADSICQGSTATFVALPANASASVAYKWTKNSSPAVLSTANTLITTALNNNDIVRCEITETQKCGIPFTDTSNEVKMTVLPWVAPSVSISANPATPLSPYQLVSFAAVPVNGGGSPQYQWTRNGSNVIGANAAGWSTQQLSNNDVICVSMTSSEKCPQPKTVQSNCIKVTVLTGVDNVADKANLQLYPNPNDGRFILHAENIHAKEVALEIVNALGQLVHRQKAAVHNNTLHENIDIRALAGAYLLKLEAEGKTYTLRFTVDR